MAIWIWRGGPADTARYGRRGQVVPASEERREAVAARQGFLAADVPPHVVEHLRVTGGPEGHTHAHARTHARTHTHTHTRTHTHTHTHTRVLMHARTHARTRAHARARPLPPPAHVLAALRSTRPPARPWCWARQELGTARAAQLIIMIKHLKISNYFFYQPGRSWRRRGRRRRSGAGTACAGRRRAPSPAPTAPSAGPYSPRPHPDPAGGSYLSIDLAIYRNI